MTRPPVCTFFAYVSQAGKKSIQEWFDGLPIEDRDEIRDTVNYLLSMPMTDWRRPEFDAVAAPLREIRCTSNALNHELRMYGVWDSKVRAQFNFLAANSAKKKSNDRKTQSLASDRLGELNLGKGSIDEFSFKEKSEREAEEKQGKSNSVGRFQPR